MDETKESDEANGKAAAAKEGCGQFPEAVEATGGIIAASGSERVMNEANSDKATEMVGKRNQEKPSVALKLQGGSPDSRGYVFAVGKLRPEFPSESVKRQFNRVAGLPPQTPASDAGVYKVLYNNPQNFYLAKSLCWVFEIGGIESYIVLPRNSNQLNDFISVLNQQNATDPMFDTIVGEVGPIAPPEMCNGRTLPLVRVRRFESMTVKDFVTNIQTETGVAQSLLESISLNLFKLTDNEGHSDEYRAINYLVFSYVELYRMLGNSLAGSPADPEIFPFNGVTAKPVDGNDRKKMQVVFQYENMTTQAQEYLSCVVDVTDMFPFVAEGMTTGKPT